MSKGVDLEIELQEVLINFGCVSNLEDMSLDELINQLTSIRDKLIEEIKTVRRLHLETIQQLEQLNNIKRDTKMPEWQYASYRNLQKEKL